MYDKNKILPIIKYVLSGFFACLVFGLLQEEDFRDSFQTIVAILIAAGGITALIMAGIRVLKGKK